MKGSLPLLGQVAVITGASSGIGAAMALEVARRGADVGLLARRLDRLQGLADQIGRLGRRAEAFVCDVTQDRSVEEAFQAFERAFGRIDWVVANAGFGVVGAVERLTIADFERQFNTNVYGVIRTVKAGLSALKNSRGLIVIIGSVAGYASGPESVPYSMSKFAIRSFAEGLRLEVARHGIGVLHVAPGFVDSEIQQVDNQGVFHADRKRAINSKFLVMPTATAARQIVKAGIRRRADVVITLHGKVIVFVFRHFPVLARGLAMLVVKSGKRARS